MYRGITENTYGASVIDAESYVLNNKRTSKSSKLI